ncbi:NUDIX hydrolase [Belliella kenyensis]|uniref:NUDIX hydrolase n=1 Tax=Belliella kenyensis TaxID=1472724 RepID=A0ABV8EQ24_9BACT|nr:CoA pyrophosphatase [Belliella kenyensis]MCH7401959.1 CoA pyrophosphatase [Belliella kenyensis]MDN3605123.1 CoA pyrophosphatase [Belliella kenyensis]
MEFDLVIERVQKMMKNPLPGKMGQLMMSPKPVDESRFGSLVPDNVRKGAVLILFYPDDNQAFVPFIKRPSYDGPHGGQVALPGGKQDETDSDLSFTALREAEEEIGVNAANVELIGNLSDLFIPPSNFLVRPYIGFTTEKPNFIPDPYEVERIIPCQVNHLIDKEIRKEGEVVVKGNFKLQAPYFDIDSEMVWGATAMMLGEFMFLWEKVKV